MANAIRIGTWMLENRMFGLIREEVLLPKRGRLCYKKNTGKGIGIKKTMRDFICVAVAYLSIASVPVLADCVLNCQGDSSKKSYRALGAATCITSIPFTLEAWVRLPAGALTSETVIMSQYFHEAKGRMVFGFNEGKIGLFLNSGGNWRTSDVDFPREQWVHVAVARGEQSYSIYTNAVKVMTYDFDKAFPKLAQTPVTVGGYVSSKYGQDEGSKFSVPMIRIADARFWSYERTPAQLSADLGHRLTGTEEGLVAYFPLTCDPDTQTSPEYVTGENALPGPYQSFVEDADFHLEPAPMRVTPVDWPVLNPLPRSTANSGVETPFGRLQPQANITIETWISIASTNQKETSVFDVYTNNVTGRGWFGLSYGRPAYWRNGMTPPQPMSSVALPTNTWVHLAFVLDRANMRQTIYTNGLKAVDQTMTSCSDFPDLPARFFGFSTGSDKCQDVLMRELRLWTNVQSQAQIEANRFKRLNGNEAGLASYYPLTEGSSSIRDWATGTETRLPGGFSWVYTNRVWLAHPSSWIVQKGFNGGSATSMKENESDAILSGRTVYTLEVWCCPHRPITGSQNENYLMNCYKSQDPGRTVLDFVNENKPNIFIGGNRLYAKDADGKDIRVPFDTWVHVAAVRNGDNVRIYINGALAGSATWTDLAPTSEARFIIAAQAEANYSANGAANSFNGVLREVRVWETARTDAQIQECYNRRLVGKERGLLRYWPLDDANTTLTEATDLKTKATLGVSLNAQWMPALPSLGDPIRPGMVLVFW